jgi:hypothetical protein
MIMPQFQVITKSYRWEYDIEEREGFECKEVGIITRQGYQDRTMAIAKGEWKPKGEPLCWFSPTEEGE